jgi:hypothetical protein
MSNTSPWRETEAVSQMGRTAQVEIARELHKRKAEGLESRVYAANKPPKGGTPNVTRKLAGG